MMPENTSRIGCVFERLDSTLANVLTTSGLWLVQRTNTCDRCDTFTGAWSRETPHAGAHTEISHSESPSTPRVRQWYRGYIS
jgi:hypothetical protein